MNDKLEKTILDIKKPGLNNPVTYVLTHIRFNAYLVLFLVIQNKAQIYKMPCRVSSQDEIEIVMSSNFLNLFMPNEHTEDYHIRKPNDEKFLFQIEDKKFFYVGDKVLSFETNDMLTVKKTFTLCYIKNIFLFKNMKLDRKKTSINVCIKKEKN